jgi:hypothetical protein
MTPAPEKEYIITEDGMDELDKYFIEHKDGLIKIAWKNLKDKHVRPYTSASSDVLDMVNIGFFYQESVPYPNGEYKFRMKIIRGDDEVATPERQNYGEAFTDLFNIGIKEHRFFRECGDEQSKRFARGVMDDITEIRQQTKEVDENKGA